MIRPIVPLAVRAMTSIFHKFQKLKIAVLACIFLGGCGIWQHRAEYRSDLDQYAGVAERLTFHDAMVDVDGPSIDHSNEGVPATVDERPRTPFPLSIEQAVQHALTNSRILRDLGARLVRAPESARSIMDPAIVETDPITGIDGALSEFDATLAGSYFAENRDFAANNLFQLQGADTALQDFGVFQLELAKRAATGTEFALRKNIEYDANNSPANLFPSAWSANIEAEFRHPLLQGNGVAFNRIAGPNGTPKNFNGVVLARLNTDISQLDFEVAIRDMVNNVENAYWDLYFAYRHLDSRIKARDAALETLKKIESREELQTGDNVLLELAREQYWEFEEEVINARSGRVVDGTRSNNGSQGGTFNGGVGLQVAERRLRLLMGWPINDDREIVPERDPAMAEVSFDWSNAIQEAQDRRAEIRKQELKLKRHGLELAATRNFLLHRVDLVGLYRFRGFGQRLLSNSSDIQRFDNAIDDLTTGDFQEWRVGIESAFPIGFRQAHAAVRSAQLRYSREQAILDELTRDVIHNLSNEYANTRRAYKTMQINFNRRHAAKNRVQILLEREKNFGVNFREVLSAQRRAADADSRFFRSLVEYVVAIKNVHFEKGSLLRYNNIYMADKSPSEQFEARATVASSEDSYRFERFDSLHQETQSEQNESERISPEQLLEQADEERLRDQELPVETLPQKSDPDTKPQPLEPAGQEFAPGVDLPSISDSESSRNNSSSELETSAWTPKSVKPSASAGNAFFDTQLESVKTQPLGSQPADFQSAGKKKELRPAGFEQSGDTKSKFALLESERMANDSFAAETKLLTKGDVQIELPPNRSPFRRQPAGRAPESKKPTFEKLIYRAKPAKTSKPFQPSTVKSEQNPVTPKPSTVTPKPSTVTPKPSTVTPTPSKGATWQYSIPVKQQAMSPQRNTKNLNQKFKTKYESQPGSRRVSSPQLFRQGLDDLPTWTPENKSSASRTVTNPVNRTQAIRQPSPRQSALRQKTPSQTTPRQPDFRQSATRQPAQRPAAKRTERNHQSLGLGLGNLPDLQVEKSTNTFFSEKNFRAPSQPKTNLRFEALPTADAGNRSPRVKPDSTIATPDDLMFSGWPIESPR